MTLHQQFQFRPEHDRVFFRVIPAEPAVFLLRGVDPGAEPYVSRTANLRRRLQRLLGPIELGSDGTPRTRKLNLRDRVRSVEFSLTGSDFESGWMIYRVLRGAFPQTYTERLRLRMAPLIKLHLENAYPRASVTTRLGRLSSGEGVRAQYYGPFYSRASAEDFLNDSLDFFMLRRCVEELNPDPAFPGCIYSEMKMCHAPCFKGCTDETYAAETARVQAYLNTGGRSLLREFEAARDAASAALDFEKAAAVHARIEKLKPVAGQLSELVHCVHQLHGLIVQRSAHEGCVALFPLHAGCIQGPLQFAIQPLLDVHTVAETSAQISAQQSSAELARLGPANPVQPRSLEARVQACLAEAPPLANPTALETMEHLAMLRRWFYRGSRTGEVFFVDEKGHLPMRRIVRGIGRVFKGEKVPENAL